MLNKGNFKKIQLKLKMFNNLKVSFNQNTILMVFKAPNKNKREMENKAHSIEAENQLSILMTCHHRIRKKERAQIY